MRNSGGIFRYIFSCTLCFSVIVYGAYSYFVQNKTVKLNDSFYINESDDFAFSQEETKASGKTVEITEQASSAETVSSNAESQPTLSIGTVKGKVITKQILSSTASLAYSNVHIKNSTDLSINIKELLTAELGFKIKKSSEPEVLIMHTHTTETFMDSDIDYYTSDFSSRTRDKEKNMIKIGEIVAQKLKSAGITAIHDTTEHDYPQYNGSYTRAAKTINSYLKKYPTIKVVIDLHRDAVSSGSDKVKLVTEIGGKKAAQVMIVMGSQSGSVTNFPNWKENLKLAVRLQQTIEVKYPNLARPLSLMSKNYNESLSKGSMLIEFGTDANSLEEACYSAEMVGDSLASLLNTIN